jgi:predicted TIM-barrel fold metal-dependent hydrolase
VGSIDWKVAFHDAHAHAVSDQVGGFLIALMGEPHLPYMMSNEEVLGRQDIARLLIGVPYVPAGKTDHEGPIAKYHARREGFSAAWVAADVLRHKRKIALIDTLNTYHWTPGDYATLAQQAPQTEFVMCHGGGYDIIEFLKMARFLKNVWLDFSATQHIFGWAGAAPSYGVICDGIAHGLAEPRIAGKLMFGSDAPGFAQLDAVANIRKHAADPAAILVGNFERLLAQSKLLG